MAPLLGRKPFPLVKPLPGEEPLFTIAHTQEAFRTREYPFPVAPARPPAGWGRAGWAAQPRAGGSCQRARRWRASTPSPSPRPAVSVGVGGRAGPAQAAPEPCALHPFLGPALCHRASLSMNDPLSRPPPQGVGFRP